MPVSAKLDWAKQQLEAAFKTTWKSGNNRSQIICAATVASVSDNTKPNCQVFKRLENTDDLLPPINSSNIQKPRLTRMNIKENWPMRQQHSQEEIAFTLLWLIRWVCQKWDLWPDQVEELAHTCTYGCGHLTTYDDFSMIFLPVLWLCIVYRHLSKLRVSLCFFILSFCL